MDGVLTDSLQLMQRRNDFLIHMQAIGCSVQVVVFGQSLPAKERPATTARASCRSVSRLRVSPANENCRPRAVLDVSRSDAPTSREKSCFLVVLVLTPCRSAQSLMSLR